MLESHESYSAGGPGSKGTDRIVDQVRAYRVAAGT